MSDIALGTYEIAALVAGSSVLAAVVTQGLSAVRDWTNKKRDSRFSALYLALALESYAAECATLIGDSENFSASDGHAGTPHGSVASLPEFPDSIEWKPLGIKATTAAMSFRVDIETTKAMIQGTWEYGDEDDVVAIVRLESARLGRQALILATSLRKMGGIEPLIFGDKEWNVAVYLDERFEDLSHKKAEWERQSRELHQELMESVETSKAA